ncbi:unnamed protein product, partial [Laminaria digitata]
RPAAVARRCHARPTRMSSVSRAEETGAAAQVGERGAIPGTGCSIPGMEGVSPGREVFPSSLVAFASRVFVFVSPVLGFHLYGRRFYSGWNIFLHPRDSPPVFLPRGRA